MDTDHSCDPNDVTVVGKNIVWEIKLQAKLMKQRNEGAMTDPKNTSRKKKGKAAKQIQKGRPIVEVVTDLRFKLISKKTVGSYGQIV